MPYLDTRDLEERKEELQDKLDFLKEALEEKKEEYKEDCIFENLEAMEEAEDDLTEWQKENQEELDELTSLSEEISEWQDGATLIPGDEFTEYCQELLEDIGDLPKDMPWYIVIDWEATADNLKADYTEVEYQGTTYLVRS